MLVIGVNADSYEHQTLPSCPLPCCAPSCSGTFTSIVAGGIEGFMRSLNKQTRLNSWEIAKARLRDKSVSSDARFLWSLIDTYADKDGSHAFPRIETLSKISGHDKQWVYKYLKELESAGWLRRSHRYEPLTGKQQSNLYILIYPIYRYKAE